MPEHSPRWFTDDRTDLTDRLVEIRAPALLLWGSADRIVPPSAGRVLSDLLPHSRFVVIPDAGHDVAVRKPEEVAQAIGAYLAEPGLLPAQEVPSFTRTGAQSAEQRAGR
jgi:pimeloyl-ACP methyl ester carboxylesterase